MKYIEDISMSDNIYYVNSCGGQPYRHFLDAAVLILYKLSMYSHLYLYGPYRAPRRMRPTSLWLRASALLLWTALVAVTAVAL